jgi:hypothetical protein
MLGRVAWFRGAETAGTGRGARASLALIGAGPAVALALVVGGPSAQAAGAEASPRLLLDGPGWRVQDADEEVGREGLHGSVEFVTGKPIPYETIQIKGSAKRETESGMFPPATRQRRVELSWSKGELAKAVEAQRHSLHPHGQAWVELPVAGTTAQVDTKAEFFANQGGPGNREMEAFWQEGPFVVELSAAVPDQAGFEERLGWVTKVSDATWEEAMPAKVVIPSEHAAAVAGMLKGIPTPKGFKASRIPNEGLTKNRYQVGARVTATVSCLWFRQWGAAQRSGDTAAEAEAEKAMATSRHWAILHEMASEGAFPEVVWTLAKEMPSGVWTWDGKTHPLLPKAEALGCARLGLPLLPSKMKAQRERAAAKAVAS